MSPITIWEWYTGIDSDNGSAPIRWQAIIGTNDNLVGWRMCASLALNVLKKGVSIREL